MNGAERNAEPGVRGSASGQGRVYQAQRDQYVTEHHHHYPSGDASSLFGPDVERVIVPMPRSATGPTPPAPDSVRTPLVGRAPMVLRDRRDLMAGLLAAARDETGGVHVLHGLGGCGKTAVAQAVFNEVTRGGGRTGLWVNASERSTLRAGMLAVAADRGAEAGELVAAHKGQRASADLVWHSLHSSSEPWLLVLDNADDPEALGEGGWLRQSPRGTVIVTTRQAGSRVWQGAHLHHLGVLPVEDAALVLRDLAPEAGSVEEAETVARRLDCLPLALTLAGSFLSRQLLESWSMSDYRRHLDDNPTELIDQGAVPGNAERNARQLVGRTWGISLATLAGDGLPECLSLLRLLSCWSSDPVPLSLIRPDAVDAALLTALDPPLTGARVEAALRGLLDHSLVSLVSLDVDGRAVRCVKTHGVVLDSVAAAVPADQRALLVTAATKLLQDAVPESGARAQDTQRVGHLVPHATNLLRRAEGTDDAGPVVALGTRLAGCLFDGGDFQAALSLAGTMAEAAARRLGPEDPATLRAEHRAATALFRLGRFEESEALHRHVLDARDRTLGPEHPETLGSRQDIHEPLSQLQRVEECLATLRDTAEIRARVLGARHQDTLHARALLIEYLAVADAVDEFDRVGPEIIAACEEHLGGDSFTTVTARHNYAFGLYRFDRPAQAEAEAREALRGRELVHGPDHALALSAAVLLSWILGKLGQVEESLALGRRVVRGQEQALGREHPYLLTNRAGLAEALAAAGEADEARALAQENLPLCERVLGPDDPVTVTTRGLVG
ncbi:tetratricopeptide repeat protein [Streptomyces sp. SR27]|uniref:tetratricopeptide repeat protein n=1 Tax=Streptomyces sp. SR27 TaxID=3076630 RepID=UPI00295B9789|nr:tetratricopeptide repeat protein [Streptomyces sp. SR27]MDV9187105.1 tetratricopeptide repeat protein [Streptomyces sp. SR27]